MFYSDDKESDYRLYIVVGKQMYASNQPGGDGLLE